MQLFGKGSPLRRKHAISSPSFDYHGTWDVHEIRAKGMNEFDAAQHDNVSVGTSMYIWWMGIIMRG